MKFTDCTPFFLDELYKIAVQLTPKERAKEFGQFAALGAVAKPVLDAVASKLTHGRWKPKDIPLRKHLPVSMLSGALWGGAVPAVRHYISSTNLDAARSRAAAELATRALVPVEQVLEPRDVSRLTGGI